MAHAKGTILCVDDHSSGLIAHKTLLERNGYKILEAADGSEGLRLFLSRSVDAVILDYQMAGMNGDVVAAEMKQLKPQIPIMLLSEYGPLPKSKVHSVDSFMSKSPPPKLLLSTLNDLLDGWSKPFFYRWWDQWKDRHQETRP